MARAHRPILAGGRGCARPSADLGRGAGWRAPIGRFWPGGWVARPSADSARGAGRVARALWIVGVLETIMGVLEQVRSVLELILGTLVLMMGLPCAQS